MSNLIYTHRYLLLRRMVQVGILVLYFGANAYGWHILEGNLSASLILGTIPMADPYAVVQMLTAGAVLALDVLLGALVALLFYGLIGGRAFCSWICPVNMVTDLASWIRRVLRFDEGLKRYAITRQIRYGMLLVSLVVSFLMGVAAFELVSPISMVHRGVVFGIGFGWAAVAVIFLFDLVVLKHGWCGHICPLGAFYSIVTRWSLIRVDYNKDACTECMKCKEICPEKQVLELVTKHSGQVLSGECTNCGRCVEVCPDDALGFSLRRTLNEKEGVTQ